MNTFKELGIAKKFRLGLKELNIENPTEIQKQAIPFLMENNADFIGQAQTGTGKTFAFVLPLLHKIDTNKKFIQAIILVPTRELGLQITKQIFKVTKFSEKVFIETVYGGKNIQDQIPRLLRPTHIIVATPGRLVELVNKKIIDLRRVNNVVLDEADEMLSLGFKEDLQTILKWTLNERKTWLFSATFPHNLAQIIDNFLDKNVRKVQINPTENVNRQIEHQYFICNEQDKIDTLILFLKNYRNERGIIFTRTKDSAKKLEDILKAKNFALDSIHGDKLQIERTKIMRAFKNKKLDYLIATDLAARGIDVENLAFVIHFELPDQTEYYTHRSGRTARAGKKGISFSIINLSELKTLKFYEKTLNITFNLLK